MRQVTESSESGPTIADLLARLRAAGFECESNVSSNLSIRGVSQDSRDIRPGDLFLALPGTTTDGARFIADASAAGAVAALCSRDVAADGYARIVVDDVVRAAGHAAAMALGDPAERMRLIGVTGTNGKTSCTYLLDHVLRAAGQSVGVLGTISQRWAGSERTASMTTPPTVELHRAFASMAAADCGWVAMEVSSHALSQHRVAGCRFDAAIFTNLTRDHLDYHGDEESYFAAKASLFLDYLYPSSGIAVLNAEDPFAMRLSGMLGADRCRTFTTRGDSDCDVSVVRAETGLDGICAELRIGSRTVELNSRLIGLPNLANIAAVAAAASAVGFSEDAIVAGIEECPPVPGRLERVGDRRPVVLVDYAHTPDALERTLAAIRENNGGGRLIAVFGCGGDRDRGKRPMMGEIAGRLADISIITSDNPRSEDPSAIVADIEEGIRPNARRIDFDDARRSPADGGGRSYMIEVERERAIFAALGVAGPADVVVVAGKGHEDYQDIAGVRHHFDDREVVRRLVESH